MRHGPSRWIALISVFSFNLITIGLALWFLALKSDKYGERHSIDPGQYVIAFLIPALSLIPCCLYVKWSSVMRRRRQRETSTCTEDDAEEGGREISINWDALLDSRQTSISIISTDTGLRLILDNDDATSASNILTDHPARLQGRRRTLSVPSTTCTHLGSGTPGGCSAGLVESALTSRTSVASSRMPSRRNSRQHGISESSCNDGVIAQVHRNNGATLAPPGQERY